MKNDLFDYGYFIYQDDNYFKFSIDSILLAEYARIRKNKNKVLDLCSGNAPVPLILNKKYGNKIDITAVELQKEIYELGVKSIKENNVTNINFINDDIKNLGKYTKDKFDVITCNPPYFLVSEDKCLNDNSVKAIQRHEIKTNLEEVIRVSESLIQNKGYFYMVHRPERLIDIISNLNKYNFGIKNITFVYNSINKPCILVLIESQYNGENYPKIGNPIYLDQHETYQGIFKEE